MPYGLGVRVPPCARVLDDNVVKNVVNLKNSAQRWRKNDLGRVFSPAFLFFKSCRPISRAAGGAPKRCRLTRRMAKPGRRAAWLIKRRGGILDGLFFLMAFKILSLSNI